MTAVTAAPRYLRTRDGITVHRDDCRRAGITSSPWPHADGMDVAALRAAMAALWLAPCKSCRPLGAAT